MSKENRIKGPATAVGAAVGTVGGNFMANAAIKDSISAKEVEPLSEHNNMSNESLNNNAETRLNDNLGNMSGDQSIDASVDNTFGEVAEAEAEKIETQVNEEYIEVEDVIEDGSDASVIDGLDTDPKVDVLQYGAISDNEGNTMDIAILNINGEPAAIIDTDTDGYADILHVNDDTCSGQLIDVATESISMDVLQDDYNQLQETYAEDNADYTNNADTSDFMI